MSCSTTIMFITPNMNLKNPKKLIMSHVAAAEIVVKHIFVWYFGIRLEIEVMCNCIKHCIPYLNENSVMYFMKS